ncbi:MAG: hypothetical protein COA79_12880 [Planctomycetota bacterium]|nr:MAG: hypothetical protein COA79_12880 [Planctomycetota bacterium]
MLILSSGLLIQYLILFLGIGIPVLIILHIWNKRSIVQKIPSLYVWKKVRKTAVNPAKQKFLSKSLIFQIIILIFLLFISLKPNWESEIKTRPEFTIVIDRSVSMKATSSPFGSRWERLKSQINESLINVGLKQDDVINIKFHPRLKNNNRKTTVKNISFILNENESDPVDMGVNQQLLYSSLSANEGKNIIYISDSINQDIIKNFKDLIYIHIKDDSHINVGWKHFWITENKISAVLKNYSNFPININIELKLDGKFITLKQQFPAIEAKGSFLFVEEISPEIFKEVNLIELDLNCVGDALSIDNKVASYRMKTDVNEVLFMLKGHNSIVKALESLGGNNIRKALNLIRSKEQLKKFDVIVSNEFIPEASINQIIVSPEKSNELFHVDNGLHNSGAESINFFSSEEVEISNSVIFEDIRKMTIFKNGQIKLIDPKTKDPILVIWEHGEFQQIALNFAIDKKQITQLPIFPFIISKIFEQFSKSEFQHWQTGKYLNGSKYVKGFADFQNIRPGSLNSLKIEENNEAILLEHTGLFSYGNKKICVNLLSNDESNIYQNLNYKPHKVFQNKIEVKRHQFNFSSLIIIIILILGIVEQFFHNRERKKG